MESRPFVSICCITYNQANYIRECLGGFMMQKTTFPFEVIIHDDASTDGTTEIIKEFKEKYPDIIKPIYQTENQYSKGVRAIYARFVYPEVQGKYIAVCEGDDLWINPLKLQKQIDFLESNSSYSMCFHNAFVKYSLKEKSHLFAKLEEREYSGEDILRKWTVPTASVVFRKSDLDYKELLNKNYLFGDIVLFLSLAEKGKIWCISEVMSIYRRHENGVSFSFNISKILMQIKHNEEIAKRFSGKYIHVQKELLCKLYLYLSLKQIRYFSPNAFKSLYKAIMNSPKSFIINFPKILYFTIGEKFNKIYKKVN